MGVICSMCFRFNLTPAKAIPSLLLPDLQYSSGICRCVARCGSIHGACGVGTLDVPVATGRLGCEARGGAWCRPGIETLTRSRRPGWQINHVAMKHTLTVADSRGAAQVMFQHYFFLRMYIAPVKSCDKTTRSIWPPVRPSGCQGTYCRTTSATPTFAHLLYTRACSRQFKTPPCQASSPFSSARSFATRSSRGPPFSWLLPKASGCCRSEGSVAGVKYPRRVLWVGS